MLFQYLGGDCILIYVAPDEPSNLSFNHFIKLLNVSASSDPCYFYEIHWLKDLEGEIKATSETFTDSMWR